MVLNTEKVLQDPDLTNQSVPADTVRKMSVFLLKLLRWDNVRRLLLIFSTFPRNRMRDRSGGGEEGERERER